jgi:sarcosine oxidase subunit beta
LASGELIEADQLVVAAGPWSVGLVAPLGIDLPIRAQRAQILLVDPGPPVEPIPVLSDLVMLQYVRSEGRNALLVGNSDHIQPEWADPDEYADRADDEYLEVAIPKFEHRFPKWQECRLSSSYAGCYDVTPDYNPIIGSSPVEGLYVCAGFSGHGYKISPSVGELVADLLCENQSRDPDIDHRDFRLARFAEDDLLRSPHPYAGAGQMR